MTACCTSEAHENARPEVISIYVVEIMNESGQKLYALNVYLKRRDTITRPAQSRDILKTAQPDFDVSVAFVAGRWCFAN